MKRLFGSREQVRAVSFADVWGEGRTWDEVNNSPALRQMAVGATLACVDVKASSIMAMPLQEFVESAGVRERVDLSPLMENPSDMFEPEEWIYAYVASMSLWDQSIGVIRATGANGWPTKLEWVSPSTVGIRSKKGRPVYTIDGLDHAAWRHGGDVVHMRRRPIPGKVDGGMSATKALDPLITVGLEGARAAASAYLAGGLPMALFMWEGDLNNEAADELSNRYAATRKKNAGRPMFMGRGWKFETVRRESITSDMTAMRKQINTEIANVHMVPPEMVGGEAGGSLTYNTLEASTRALDVRALLPIYTQFERSLSRLLPSPRIVRFNADVTIRTSLIDQANADDAGIRGGWLAVNEVRKKRNMPPVPGGDVTLWPPYAASIQATQPQEGNQS